MLNGIAVSGLLTLNMLLVVILKNSLILLDIFDFFLQYRFRVIKVQNNPSMLSDTF